MDGYCCWGDHLNHLDHALHGDVLVLAVDVLVLAVQSQYLQEEREVGAGARAGGGRRAGVQAGG